MLQGLRELGIEVTAVCTRLESPFARAAQAAEVSLVIGATPSPRTRSRKRAWEILPCAACLATPP